MPLTDVFMRHQPIVGLALAAAAAINTDEPDGSPTPPAKLWEQLSGYERQLLLTLPDGTQGRDMLVAMLLEAVQAAHPSQVCSRKQGCSVLSLANGAADPSVPWQAGGQSADMVLG